MTIASHQCGLGSNPSGDAMHGWSLSIRKSHDFCWPYSLFMARVASFVPKRSEGANDAIITNAQIFRQIFRH